MGHFPEGHILTYYACFFLILHLLKFVIIFLLKKGLFLAFLFDFNLSEDGKYVLSFSWLL